MREYPQRADSSDTLLCLHIEDAKGACYSVLYATKLHQNLYASGVGELSSLRATLPYGKPPKSHTASSGQARGYSNLCLGNLRVGLLQCPLQWAAFENGLEVSISAECGHSMDDRHHII